MTSLPSPPELPFDGALFLDFDGTLSELRGVPDACFLSKEQIEILNKLDVKLGGALALISGRDVRDLSKRVPNGLYRAGSHGLEICLPGMVADFDASPAPPSLQALVQDLVDGISNTRLEIKGEVLTVHYRKAPDRGGDVLAGMVDIVEKYPEYKVQDGKFVVEAKPLRANKGAAIEQIMSFASFDRKTPIMIGDDTTDEDAMKVVKDLGGWSIKVGEGETIADYHLPAVKDVWNWLKEVSV